MIGESKKTMTFSETRRDFSNAWSLLKDNYKAFLETEIFSGIAFLITAMITALSFGLIISSFTSTTLREISTDFSNNFILSHLIRFGIVLIGSWIFYAFLNSQFGLAHEIMSSGEMFAEFKSSFGYFKKFWWQYPVLTFNIMAIDIIFPLNFRFGIFKRIDNKILVIFIIIVQIIIFFFWFITFISTLPSLTFQGNFKKAYIESFRIVKKNLKRLIFTWGIFFLIFIAPGAVIMILNSMYFNWTLSILTVIYILLLSFLGYPMMSLLATGLYKNVEFKRFKPLIE